MNEIGKRVTGLQHIGLPTNDMEATLAFYQSLGFTLAHQADNDIRLDFVETPCVRIVKLALEDGHMVLKQTETPGVPYVYRKLRQAAQSALYNRLQE